MAHRTALLPLVRRIQARSLPLALLSPLPPYVLRQSSSTRHAFRSQRQLQQCTLGFSTSSKQRSVYDDFRNIYDDTEKPAVMVDNINETSFKLTDGVILPCNAIFHNGVAFMWDTPPAAFGWQGWNKEMFEIFEFTSPKPDILLFGTGKQTLPPPPFLRPYLNSLGIQLDVMDSRNACSTFNLLAEEGRRVAAAVLTLTPIECRTGAPIEAISQ